MVSLGLRFNDCFFTEPVRLGEWTAPRCAGIYVVLAPDSNWAPKPFRPLFFAEFGNNAAKSVALKQYLDVHGDKSAVLISALSLPFSTSQQRWALCAELIWAYNPSFQTDLVNTPPAHLRPNPQSTPETQPEPRRRIGFLPFTDTPPPSRA